MDNSVAGEKSRHDYFVGSRRNALQHGAQASGPRAASNHLNAAVEIN